MFCGNCGKEVQEGTAFCPNCGNKFNVAIANSAQDTVQNRPPEPSPAPEIKPVFCGNCGKQVQEGSPFCPNCGSKASATSETTTAMQNPEPVPAPENKPVFCGNCGKQVQEGSPFCPNCGSKASATSETTTAMQNPEPIPAPEIKPVFCGNCGKQMQEGSPFCPNCGAKLGTARENTVHAGTQQQYSQPRQTVYQSPPIEVQPIQSAVPEGKYRHGFTSFWLWLQFVVGILGTVLGIIGMAASDDFGIGFPALMSGLIVGVVTGVGSFLIMRWYISGFYMIAGVYVTDIVISIAEGSGAQGIALLIGLAITFGVLNLRSSQNGKTAWEQLSKKEKNRQP